MPPSRTILQPNVLYQMRQILFTFRRGWWMVEPYFADVCPETEEHSQPMLRGRLSRSWHAQSTRLRDTGPRSIECPDESYWSDQTFDRPATCKRFKARLREVEARSRSMSDPPAPRRCFARSSAASARWVSSSSRNSPLVTRMVTVLS
jgi:hypothetical protein